MKYVFDFEKKKVWNIKRNERVFWFPRLKKFLLIGRM